MLRSGSPAPENPRTSTVPQKIVSSDFNDPRSLPLRFGWGKWDFIAGRFGSKIRIRVEEGVYTPRTAQRGWPGVGPWGRSTVYERDSFTPKRSERGFPSLLLRLDEGVHRFLRLWLLRTEGTGQRFTTDDPLTIFGTVPSFDQVTKRGCGFRPSFPGG